MPGTPAECMAMTRWCAILVGVEPKKNSLFPCVHVVKYEFAYKFISSLLHSGRKSSAATFHSKMNPVLAPRWLREYNNHHIITGALNGNTPELVSAPRRLKLSPFQSAPLRQTPSHVRVERNTIPRLMGCWIKKIHSPFSKHGNCPFRYEHAKNCRNEKGFFQCGTISPDSFFLLYKFVTLQSYWFFLWKEQSPLFLKQHNRENVDWFFFLGARLQKIKEVEFFNNF